MPEECSCHSIPVTKELVVIPPKTGRFRYITQTHSPKRRKLDSIAKPRTDVASQGPSPQVEKVANPSPRDLVSRDHLYQSHERERQGSETPLQEPGSKSAATGCGKSHQASNLEGRTHPENSPSPKRGTSEHFMMFVLHQEVLLI